MEKIGARRRLALRVQAWNGLKSAKLDTKAASRLAAGGYKCPGSYKR